MAIAAIYILLGLASIIYAIGFTKEEYIAIMFSGILFILAGVSIVVFGFQDIPYDLGQWVGLVVIFLGVYLSLRPPLEMILESI